MLTLRDQRARKTMQQVTRQWTDCTRCPLHERRYQVVQARGTMPCDVLFIGEAPGKTEDVLGEPFRGQAGKVLDSWIADMVAAELLLENRYAIINTVGCWPQKPVLTAEGEMWKTREPEQAEMEACQPRFALLCYAANPRVIVHLGKTASSVVQIAKPRAKQPAPDWVLNNIARYGNRPVLDLPHPAWILRMGGLYSEEYQRAKMRLSVFLQAHLV